MGEQISIGRMTRRMIVEQATELPDDGGGVETLWETVAENPVIYVQDLQVKAAEKLRFAQAARQVTHKIATRGHPALVTGNRLADEAGNTFRITETGQAGQRGGYVVCYLEQTV